MFAVGLLGAGLYLGTPAVDALSATSSGAR